MGRFRRFWSSGVSFFCSIVKDDASFYQSDHCSFTVCPGVRETGLRDVRVDIYAVCPVWPSCAIVREDPRIFFAHTLRHLLVEDVNLLFLGPPE
jgi:hypothetical protein